MVQASVEGVWVTYTICDVRFCRYVSCWFERPGRVLSLPLDANMNAKANLIDGPCAALVTPGVFSNRSNNSFAFPFKTWGCVC